MKKEDLLKLGLEEEAAKKVADAWAEELKGYIPKTRFDEVNNDKKKLELDVRDRDSQLETLKNSTGDVEGLKKQIETLQTENKTKDKAHASEIKELKVNAAIDSALVAAKAKNSKAVRALLDLDVAKIEFADDGSIKELAEKIKQLQGAEDSKFLFDTETKKATVKGAKPGETGKEEPDDKVDTSKMTYEELAAFLEQNPDAQI